MLKLLTTLLLLAFTIFVVTTASIWILDHPAVKDACVRFHNK